MHNPEPVLDNETDKLRWDFEMKTDYLISHGKSERKEQYVSRPCKKTEKTMERQSNDDTSCSYFTRYSHQRIGKGSGGIGNKRNCP